MGQSWGVRLAACLFKVHKICRIVGANLRFIGALNQALPPTGDFSVTEPHALLAHEWTTLQNNHEQIERSALWIKLAAVALVLSGLALSVSGALVLFMVLLLWLQEGIVRTSQARLGARMLQLEAMVQRNEVPLAQVFQLHSVWQATRPGALGLMAEYLSHAMRPTVIYPYALLVLGILFWSIE
jgi:hypothetical protein